MRSSDFLLDILQDFLSRMAIHGVQKYLDSSIPDLHSVLAGHHVQHPSQVLWQPRSHTPKTLAPNALQRLNSNNFLRDALCSLDVSSWPACNLIKQFSMVLWPIEITSNRLLEANEQQHFNLLESTHHITSSSATKTIEKPAYQNSKSPIYQSLTRTSPPVDLTWHSPCDIPGVRNQNMLTNQP